MSQNDDLKVYGRIVGNDMVEYPVYGIHIKNRAHPMTWYKEAIFDDKPEVPAFHYAVEIPKYKDGVLRVSYKLEVMALSTLLHQAAGKHVFHLMPPGQEAEPRKIADVDPALVERIKTLIDDYVQGKLDTFAKAKGYGSMTNLVSYKDSTVTQWVEDAIKGLEVRDATWQAVIDYMGKVLTDAVEIPSRLSDIDAVLPEMSWTPAV
jgi:hypothetical protein